MSRLGKVTSKPECQQPAGSLVFSPKSERSPVFLFQRGRVEAAPHLPWSVGLCDLCCGFWLQPHYLPYPAMPSWTSACSMALPGKLGWGKEGRSLGYGAVGSVRGWPKKGNLTLDMSLSSELSYEKSSLPAGKCSWLPVEAGLSLKFCF